MCLKYDFFIGDIVEWNSKTILLRDTKTNTIFRVLLHDADGLARLIGRKRNRLWLRIDDAMLTDVQWIRKSGRGVTLRYFQQADRWFDYI